MARIQRARRAAICAAQWLSPPATTQLDAPSNLPQARSQFEAGILRALITLIVSVLITFLGVVFDNPKDDAFLKIAVETTATSTGEGEPSSRGSRGWTRAEFQDQDGNLVLTTIDSLEPDDAPAGSRHQILYYPGVPHKARLKDDLYGPLGEIVTGVGLLGLGAGLGMAIYQFWWRRTLRRLSADGTWYACSTTTVAAFSTSSTTAPRPSNPTLLPLETPVARTLHRVQPGDGHLWITSSRRVLIRDCDERLVIATLPVSPAQHTKWHRHFDQPST